jgi:acyl-CoA synthetase (AMP-forming)/AMP-acid ligase II/peptidoglycan/LPS O-acetylase OafA/YrhL
MGPTEFSALRTFGAAVALVDEHGAEVTYAELADRCAAFLEKFGPGRQLVLLEVANDLASVVAYLSALEGGHAVILTGESAAGSDARILRDFAPNVLYRHGKVRRFAEAAPVELHPDLSLLLPTSGSTGSPKLVRLSRRNLEANAQAIVDYLKITPAERAITSLPFHYSYGMSVLNSHLRAGASVVLTELSVTNPQFWDLFRQTAATSIAGVPYSYELFERIGLRDDPPKTLRTMTQAGGRLAPELVKAYATFGADHGVSFYTMYGQTEAAPRMAYLPPALAAANPDCIGVAIPGGEFRLIDEDGVAIAKPEVTGELVYRGPNVMLGYAYGRDDLAKGAEVEELRTGDLAVRTRAKLYRIVGRASRFVKIAGLRIGLDDLEAMLAEAGHKAFAAGTDARIAICVVGDTDPGAVREFVAERCGLPIAAVTAFAQAEEPRLSTGKVDYQSVRALGEAQALEEEAALEGGGVIATAYAKALGIALPPEDATFASLGGDSLSYVNASIGVERALGHLPEAWESMPIASLEAMVQTTTSKRPAFAWISSDILVRIAALMLVMAGHAMAGRNEPDPTEWLRGGSNMLFAMAGFSLARFQGQNLLKGSVGPAISGTIYRVILPYLLCLAVMLPTSQADRSIGWPLLISVFTVDFRGPAFPFWFIETLFHSLLITCGLFLIPPVRRLAAAKPFGFSLLLIAGATVLMWGMPYLWHDNNPRHLTFDAWLYAYYLGWAAYQARRPWQKGLLLAIAAVLAGLEYGLPNSREVWLTLALAVVMFAPRLKLPTLANRVVMPLAAASYFIYLAHAFVVHVLIVKGTGIQAPIPRIVLLWVGSAIAGLAFAWGWNLVAPRARQIIVGWAGRLRPGRAKAA